MSVRWDGDRNPREFDRALSLVCLKVGGSQSGPRVQLLEEPPRSFPIHSSCFDNHSPTLLHRTLAQHNLVLAALAVSIDRAPDLSNSKADCVHRLFPRLTLHRVSSSPDRVWLTLIWVPVTTRVIVTSRKDHYDAFLNGLLKRSGKRVVNAYRLPVFLRVGASIESVAVARDDGLAMFLASIH